MKNQNVISFNELDCYVLTLETSGLVDLFVRAVYKQIIVHTLNHFIVSKGLILYGWCLMPNRLYLVCRTAKGVQLTDLRAQFKQFTTEKIIDAIEAEPEEKKAWLVERFNKYTGLLRTARNINCWKPMANPLILDMRRPDLIAEQIELIHSLPVKERIVQFPEDYLYSSARDYDGAEGLVKIIKLSPIEQEIDAIKNRKSSFKARNYK